MLAIARCSLMTDCVAYDATDHRAAHHANGAARPGHSADTGPDYSTTHQTEQQCYCRYI